MRKRSKEVGLGMSQVRVAWLGAIAVWVMSAMALPHLPHDVPLIPGWVWYRLWASLAPALLITLALALWEWFDMHHRYYRAAQVSALLFILGETLWLDQSLGAPTILRVGLRTIVALSAIAIAEVSFDLNDQESAATTAALLACAAALLLVLAFAGQLRITLPLTALASLWAWSRYRRRRI